jgi:hypothetical protein
MVDPISMRPGYTFVMWSMRADAGIARNDAVVNRLMMTKYIDRTMRISLQLLDVTTQESATTPEIPYLYPLGGPMTLFGCICYYCWSAFMIPMYVKAFVCLFKDGKIEGTFLDQSLVSWKPSSTDRRLILSCPIRVSRQCETRLPGAY